MKRWHYAAIAGGSVALLLAGFIVGVTMCRSIGPARVIVEDDSASEIGKVAREVLSRPSALALLSSTASAPSAELRVITSRSKTEMRAGEFFVSSDSPERFAIAREDLSLLQQCGLIDPIRSSKDSGREIVTYSLSSEGHRVSKALLEK